MNGPVFILFLCYFNRKKEFLTTPAQDILIQRWPYMLPHFYKLSATVQKMLSVVYMNK